jgi:hypothetical protein
VENNRKYEMTVKKEILSIILYSFQLKLDFYLNNKIMPFILTLSALEKKYPYLTKHELEIEIRNQINENFKKYLPNLIIT